MRAVFVDLSEDLYDRHGIYALAAILSRAGASVDYLCGSPCGRLADRVAALRPELVLYSSFSHSLADYAAFDALLKRRATVTSLIGGAGPTFNPRYIDRTTIDAACIGEGDVALPEFLAGGFRACPNIRLRNQETLPELNRLAEPDSLPRPDRDVVYRRDGLRKQLPSKQFVSGRGCPYLCTYCFNHSYNKLTRNHGDIVRKKSVAYLLEEIDSVRKRYPLRMAVFNDDTFIARRDWFFRFAEAYPSRIGIPYSCNIRANLVDEDIVRALKASGCVAVNWSIECGDEKYRNAVLKRNIRDDQILQTAELLNRHGIPHRIGNLIGLPGETREQMLKTVTLNAKARPAYALANIFVPYPGLDLTRYAVEMGYYREKPEDELPRNYFSRSEMDVPPDLDRWIRSLVYAFPFFVGFPRLFESHRLRDALLRAPRLPMRVAYELFFGYMFRKVYRVRSGPWITLRLFIRHIQSLFG